MDEELVSGAFLSSFFQVTLERLASRDFMDYFRRGKLDDMLLEKLDITLNSINQVLEEAETKQYQSSNVKKWLGDLNHVVYEADQLFDEIATDAELKKLKAESQPATSKVLGFSSAFTNPFESTIKELVEKLEFLAKQKDVLGLKQGARASNEGGVSWKSSKRFPTTSLVDESSLYGRDGDKEEIISFLLSDNDSGSHVPIISIVALGGIGKTTLAQLVFNDHRMHERFELKAWVSISESFCLVGCDKSFLRSFRSSADDEVLNLLQQELQQELTGKKYLLVLDDVLNRNGERWQHLLLPFIHGSSGSKIIVTTRDKEVASVMQSTHLLHLKQLEESDCWSLFVKHAFHGKNLSEYPKLESIGKRIVDKCGGLPLAVKTMGNLLQRKFSEHEWFKILETDLWRLSDGDNNINPVLRLSYHNLPSNLKRCFAYCSIFPKGYKFDKDQVIKLWMAEGLLKCCRIDKSEEELGNEFFDDLVSISFFQQAKRGSDDFLMHDLVNDLAKSVSGEFCLPIEGDRVHDIPESTRHIWCSLDVENGGRNLEHICKIKGLRSLMVEEKGYGDLCVKISIRVQHYLFSRLKYLRMLSFCGCIISELSDEISNLKLLRYLNLSGTEITSLPDSICMLYNLQTLLLKYCKLTELPSDFYKLVNLRHLYLDFPCIKKMPKQIGRLNHLQTLTNFVVGDHSGCDIKELAKLNNLQGIFCIKGLENVIDPTDAAEANLKDKKHLEELCMTYSATREMDDSIIERDVSVLEALQPNNNLNRLSIYRYQGSSFPKWLGHCHLPNLVYLNLWGCEFCSRLPPLGQLPSLKELSISRCHEIEIIGEEFYGNNSSNVPFRSLEILKINDMSEWKEWLCLEGCFPLLKELSITYCSKLKRGLPQHLPSLQILQIHSCQELEVSIPKADNISEIDIQVCDKVLVNELPSSLKKVTFWGTRIIESSSSLLQNLLNNAFLEELGLDVRDFKECSSLDLHCCNSLRDLSIRGWRYSSLPFALHLFTNLHSLELRDCPELESFPRGGLPSGLSSLVIYNCPKLIALREGWGLFELNALKSFHVSDALMESFPEENLLPPTISSLELTNCSKLRIMDYRGLLHLKSLESLRFYNCPCLVRLPEEGLSNSLSTLSINDCSLLKQRYQKEGGERWHTICHIPSVRIDHELQE